MKKLFTLTVIALFASLLDASGQGYRRWDFTNWSQQTIENLKADAAEGALSGWSDIEKKADAEAGTPAPEATAGKCFWLTDPDGGTLKANGVEIAELQGLEFGAQYTNNRSLAIAIDYPKTSLGEYAGPQYLWLGGGGKNMVCFTIPDVFVGQKITMTVESHKPTDARGVELYVGSIAAENKIGESFKPTTQDTYTWENWTLPEGVETETGTIDIIVYNTSGCHIYNMEIGVNIEQSYNVGYLYDGDLSGDLGYGVFSSDYSHLTPAISYNVTPIQTNRALTLDELRAFDFVVVSSTVNDAAAAASLWQLQPFLPMLNLNAQLYPVWGCGSVTDSGTDFAELAKVLNPGHNIFKDAEEVFSGEEEGELIYGLAVTGGSSYPCVTLGGLFANDPVLATAFLNPEAVAIHTHNLNHNGYVFLPFSNEVLDAFAAPKVLANAAQLLAASKAEVSKAGKPTIKLTYKKLNTDIAIESGVVGAEIFYTLDGTEPTEQSTRYTGPINVTAECTVKAVARGDGYLMSDVAETLVELKDLADTPVIAVNHADGQATVSITAVEGAEIWFNLIGSNEKNRCQLYTEPFTLTATATVAAFVEGDESLLRSELATQQVNISGRTYYTTMLTMFEGASYNNATNKVPNGGYNYYTEEILRTETLKDINGEDSLVYYYVPRDSMVIVDLSDDWHVRTMGQGLYYTKATLEHKVANASGYNPETVFDDQLSDGECTNNAMQFQTVSKKDGEGRLDPVNLSLETKRTLTGPFEVAIYYSGKDVGNPHVLDVMVSTDTLNADGWQKIGQMQSVSQPYLDNGADKSFRIWKRGTAVYNGTDAVFVRVAAVEGAKDVNIFTVVVNAPGIDDAIDEVATHQPVSSQCYDLQGRRIQGTPQRGIYIRNGRKYLAQ